MSPDLPTVPVFYDFAEPLAFVAHMQVHELWREVPVRFAWVPLEIHPETPKPSVPRPAEQRTLDATTQARFDDHNLGFKPSPMLPNTDLALRSALWASREDEAAGVDFRDAVFRRLYEQGRDIHHPDVLAGLVERVGLDPIAYLDDIKGGAMADELRANGVRAEQVGVRAVPTFQVGRSLLVNDAPWTVLDEAIKRFVESSTRADAVPGPPERAAPGQRE